MKRRIRTFSIGYDGKKILTESGLNSRRAQNIGGVIKRSKFISLYEKEKGKD